MLLELQNWEDMEIEIGEVVSRGLRAPGAAVERRPGQGDHIIYWFPWEGIYGYKKNLFISQDTPASFVMDHQPRSPLPHPHSLKDQGPGRT
jgi:hypothetical protein